MKTSEKIFSFYTDESNLVFIDTGDDEGVVPPHRARAIAENLKKLVLKNDNMEIPYSPENFNIVLADTRSVS